MREKGFEPSQALSYESLNLARLTTPAFPLDSFLNYAVILKLCPGSSAWIRASHS